MHNDYKKYGKPNKWSQNQMFMFTIGLCFIIYLWCREKFNVIKHSSFCVDIFGQFTAKLPRPVKLFQQVTGQNGQYKVCLDTSMLVNKHDYTGQAGLATITRFCQTSIAH